MVSRLKRVAVVSIATASLVLVGVGLRLAASHEPRSANDFDHLRPQLDAVLNLPAAHDGERRSRYRLPEALADLSVNGTIEVDADGGVFVPLWTGIPDDAGGFCYSPHRSAPANDLTSYGDHVRSSTHLAAGWWTCNMASDLPG